jgi:hypothetical protein
MRRLWTRLNERGLYVVTCSAGFRYRVGGLGQAQRPVELGGAIKDVGVPLISSRRVPSEGPAVEEDTTLLERIGAYFQKTAPHIKQMQRTRPAQAMEPRR